MAKNLLLEWLDTEDPKSLRVMGTTEALTALVEQVDLCLRVTGQVEGSYVNDDGDVAVNVMMSRSAPTGSLLANVACDVVSEPRVLAINASEPVFQALRQALLNAVEFGGELVSTLVDMETGGPLVIRITANETLGT